MIISTLTTVAANYYYEPNAKIDGRIDVILQTLSARCGLALPSGFYQQPLNYHEIRTFLTQAENCEYLTHSDKELLQILQSKYSGENKIFGHEDSVGKKRIQVNLDLTGDIRGNYADATHALDAFGIISPKISANFGTVSLYSEMDVWTQYRSDTVWYRHDYSPFRGQTYNIIGDDSSSLRALDSFRGGASMQFEKARIDVAVDNLTSGPAVYNRLILNAVNNPIFYTRFVLDFGRVQYYQIFGLLKELRYHNKFLYYHRLQFPFFQNKLVLGFNASIVSGTIADEATMREPHGQYVWFTQNERKIEPSYMIPFVPYLFAEHYNGDRDNVQMDFDFELRFPQSVRWYGEFLLNDATAPHTIFSDSWVNKWAFTLGTQWFPIVAGKTTVFGFEYCRVEPWVYTHFGGVATNHEHYGKSIGAELGPNSAQIRGLAQVFLSQRHGFQLDAVHSRFNRNARGGNIGDVFVYDYYPDYNLIPDSQTKEFLGKDYSSEYEVTLSHLFRQFQRYEMKTSLIYGSEKGIGIGFWGGWRF